MFVLVINGSDHPKGSLSSNCLLALRVTLLEEKKPPNRDKTSQHNSSASHLEAFRGCEWISIHFPVYKNQVVLNNLLSCWTVLSKVLDFPLPPPFPLPERCFVLLCWVGLFPGGGRSGAQRVVTRLPPSLVVCGALGCWGCLGKQWVIRRWETVPLRGWLFIFKAFVPQVACKADAWGVLLKLDCTYSLVCL